MEKPKPRIDRYGNLDKQVQNYENTRFKLKKTIIMMERTPNFAMLSSWFLISGCSYSTAKKPYNSSKF